MADKSSENVRQIPGFTWDPIKKRYFPSASTTRADRHEHQSQQRAKQRTLKIKELQQQQQQKQQQQQQQQQEEGIQMTYTKRRKWQLSAPHYARRRQIDAVWAQHHYSRDAGMQLQTELSLGFNSPMHYHSDTYESGFATCISGVGYHAPVAAVGHNNGNITLLDLRDRPIYAAHRQRRYRLLPIVSEQEKGTTTSVHILPNNRMLYTQLGGEEYGDRKMGGNICVKSGLRADAPKLELSFPGASVYTACKPPADASDRTAVGITDGLFVLSMGDGQIAEVAKFHIKSDVFSSAFAMDSEQMVICGGRDGKMRLFDIRTDYHSIKKSKRGIIGCSSASSINGVGSYGTRVVGLSADSQVNMWDLRMTNQKWMVAGGYKNINRSLSLSAYRLGYSVEEGIVACAGNDHTIRVWSMTTGAMMKCVMLDFCIGQPCTAVDLRIDPITGLLTLFQAQDTQISCYFPRLSM